MRNVFYSLTAIKDIFLVFSTLETFRLHIAFNRSIETRIPLVFLLSFAPFSRPRSMLPRFVLLPCRFQSESTRKGSRGERAFSNRISYCRLGNSRRIEITHYTVMSGAFTVVPRVRELARIYACVACASPWYTCAAQVRRTSLIEIRVLNAV